MLLRKSLRYICALIWGVMAFMISYGFIWIKILKSNLSLEEILIKEIACPEWIFTTVGLIVICVLDYKIANMLTNNRNEHAILGVVATVALFIAIILYVLCNYIVDVNTIGKWCKIGHLVLLILIVIYKAGSLQVKYKTNDGTGVLPSTLI